MPLHGLLQSTLGVAMPDLWSHHPMGPGCRGSAAAAQGHLDSLPVPVSTCPRSHIMQDFLTSASRPRTGIATVFSEKGDKGDKGEKGEKGEKE
eukprot:CAMPEP_0171096938 /NCGR_PEP_ID=MMETSP0766_2-20121228/46383_1 /TAXON_ID=439317 /ORGANISM="Gambierdiscus australes, Strain CAWD 149" /LENGTH=92 /DNA_ID=CAMNT_0011556029 /DNA_START=44 /DNA_END=322 /DNA_ORIENTATION=+